MICIYDWFGYELPIQERYRAIRKAGFDGVLVWWSDSLNRGDYRGGPRAARNAGLYVENLHTPFQVQDHLWLDNLEGETAAQCYLQCVADCAEFEIPTMVVHLPDDDKPHTPLGLVRIRRIADKAEQLGVKVALENLNNLSNLSFVLEQVESPQIGWCYDCGHHYRFHPEEALPNRYGSRLMALHLHDIKAVSPDGSYAIHRLPFDGTLDWPAVMRQIAETGYTGATAIEAMNWDYQDFTFDQFLEEAAARAQRLEAMRIHSL